VIGAGGEGFRAGIVAAAWLASLGATLAASVVLVLMQAWRATWQQNHPAAA